MHFHLGNQHLAYINSLWKRLLYMLHEPNHTCNLTIKMDLKCKTHMVLVCMFPALGKVHNMWADFASSSHIPDILNNDRGLFIDMCGMSTTCSIFFGEVVTLNVKQLRHWRRECVVRNSFNNVTIDHLWHGNCPLQNFCPGKGFITIPQLCSEVKYFSR